MNYKFLSSAGPTLFILGLALVFAGDFAVAALALLLVFAGLGVTYTAERVRRQENAKNPITEVEATVVGHRMETYHGRYSGWHVFHITFKPEDGSESLEFGGAREGLSALWDGR